MTSVDGVNGMAHSEHCDKSAFGVYMSTGLLWVTFVQIIKYSGLIWELEAFNQMIINWREICS